MLNQCTNTYLNQCTNTFLQNKHLKINVKSRNTHNADFRSKGADFLSGSAKSRSGLEDPAPGPPYRHNERRVTENGHLTAGIRRFTAGYRLPPHAGSHASGYRSSRSATAHIPARKGAWEARSTPAGGKLALGPELGEKGVKGEGKVTLAL